MVEGAFKQYRLWLAASPLDRLKIPAPSEQELSKGFFLEPCPTGLGDVDAESSRRRLKQEMIAMRQWIQ